VLAAHAGTRLGGRGLKQHVTPTVRDEHEPEARWYRALETMVPGSFRVGGTWRVRDQGQLYDYGDTGSIREPVKASADLCRRLHVATTPTSVPSR
jgi:hypothetical protein